MAIDVGSLVVNLQANLDDLKKGLAEGQSGVKGFKSKTDGFVKDIKQAFATLGIGAVLKDTFMAFGEYERSVTMLTQALRNQGIESQAAVRDLEAFAQQVENTTIFQDDAVLSLNAMLASMGVVGNDAKRATLALANFASATGKDLPEAGNILAQAINGQSRELKKYGLEIKDGQMKSENFAQTIDFLNSKFAGQSEVLRGTALGSIAAFQNAINSLQKEVGAFLASPGVGMIKWFTDLAQKAGDGLARIRQFAEESGGLLALLGRNVALVIAAVIGAMLELISKTPGVNMLLGLLGTSIAQIQAAVDGVAIRVTNLTQKWIGDAPRVVAAEKAKAEAVSSFGSTFNETMGFTKSVNKEATGTMLAEYSKNIQARTQAEKEFAEFFITTSAEWVQTVMAIMQHMFQNFGNGVADMIMEGRRFSDVLKEIWKDLAREVISQIAQMVAKWLVFQALTGGGGGLMGRFLGGRGFAEGGIVGEPSVLTGLKSGVSRMVGEAGPEAVVPLSGRNMTASEAGISFGGGGGDINVSFNISGEFIEGNPARWQNMIKGVIIPELKRWAMSYPGGAINRVRGASA